MASPDIKNLNIGETFTHRDTSVTRLEAGFLVEGPSGMDGDRRTSTLVTRGALSMGFDEILPDGSVGHTVFQFEPSLPTEQTDVA